MSAVLGRQGELDEIGRFLDAVEGGGFRVFVLSGQAGIGKTICPSLALTQTCT